MQPHALSLHQYLRPFDHDALSLGPSLACHIAGTQIHFERRSALEADIVSPLRDRLVRGVSLEALHRCHWNAGVCTNMMRNESLHHCRHCATTALSKGAAFGIVNVGRTGMSRGVYISYNEASVKSSIQTGICHYVVSPSAVSRRLCPRPVHLSNATDRGGVRGIRLAQGFHRRD